MKKTVINLICSILLLCTNTLISFFLSPYIVENIGVEANGFITLASNFVTYAQLIVTALNSMAARFISIEYVKKDYKKANMYYNSVFWGNLIIVAILIIPSIIALIKLESLVNIPDNIVFDIKILFAFIFFNFFITTGFPNWDCGTFVTNRLDRTYIPQVIASIVRCLFLFITFSYFTPKVYYVGIAATIMILITLICNGYNTNKLTPELKISFFRKKIICSWNAIKELVISGIWNSISNVGNILLTGVDLIICNVYLGATAMGVVSLTKIIPNYMDTLSSSINDVFNPEMTINYAKNNKEKMLNDINRSMKLSSLIITIPISVFIVFGEEFFKLWVPSQDAKMLQILSILASFKFIFLGGTRILLNLFTTFNKTKDHAIFQLITGGVSILLTILIVKYTKYGIYAVAGVSSLCVVLKNIVLVIPACSKYLNVKCKIFYKQVFISIFSSAVLILVGYIIKHFINISSWIQLILTAMGIGIIGLFINVFITLNKNERKYLKEKILKKFI